MGKPHIWGDDDNRTTVKVYIGIFFKKL